MTFRELLVQKAEFWRSERLRRCREGNIIAEYEATGAENAYEAMLLEFDSLTIPTHQSISPQ